LRFLANQSGHSFAGRQNELACLPAKRRPPINSPNQAGVLTPCSGKKPASPEGRRWKKRTGAGLGRNQWNYELAGRTLPGRGVQIERSTNTVPGGPSSSDSEIRSPEGAALLGNKIQFSAIKPTKPFMEVDQQRRFWRYTPNDGHREFARRSPGQKKRLVFFHIHEFNSKAGPVSWKKAIGATNQGSWAQERGKKASRHGTRRAHSHLSNGKFPLKIAETQRPPTKRFQGGVVLQRQVRAGDRIRVKRSSYRRTGEAGASFGDTAK